MSSALDWARRVTVYTLTYVLGFLGALTIVAACTQLESTIWLPLGMGLIYFVLLGLLPPFRNIVLRLPLTGVITSGSLAAWFISEPPAASEPNHRITVLAPILGATGPLLCVIVVLLLWEERQSVGRAIWNWLCLLVVLSWLVSYFSASHSIDGVLVLPHSSFRYNSDIGRVHSLAHRGVLQVLFYGAAVVAGVGLATCSKASRVATVALGLGLPIALALFDEVRFRIEFSEHVAKRSLTIDLASIAVAFVVAAAAARLGRRDSPSR